MQARGRSRNPDDMAKRSERASRLPAESAVVAAVLLVVGLVGGLALGFAVFDDDDDDGIDAAAEVDRGGPLPVAAVVADPSDHYGRQLSLVGTVGDILGPHAFVMPGSGEVAGELLVVTERPRGSAAGSEAGRPLLQGDRAWVHGELAIFDRAEVEERIGSELADVVDAHEGEPAFVAERVDLTAQLYPVARRVRAVAIADRPERYLGQLARVTGTVTERVGSAAVVLDERVIVLNASGEDELPAAGSEVEVIGPVRPFDLDQIPAEARADFDDRLFGDLIDRPAVLGHEFRSP